jgi:carboxypeptidase Q
MTPGGGVQRRGLLLAALGACATGGCVSQGAAGGAPYNEADLVTARALRERALQSTLAWELVQSLVTTAGPRPAGSAAYDRAVEWALERFTQLRFANVRAESLPLTVWQRGETHVEIAAPQVRVLAATALGNSIGTGGRTLEADVAYYADFESLKSDSTSQARGRIVFIDQHTERRRDEAGYGKAVPARFAGPAEAAKRGALALVIRSIGTDGGALPHTGMMRYDPQSPAVPAVAVAAADADRIAQARSLGAPLRLRLRMDDTRRVAGTSRNVIAELPGGDLAREVVLLGAHLDSWDIAPGALDDGTGVAIVTAAARMLIEAGVQPRRTIRVVLFANEENGLDGARAYAARYAGTPHQLVGESDLGADRIWRMASRVNAQALPAMAPLADLLRPLGIDHAGNEGAPAPDASVLMSSRGWPALELAQDATRYFDVHHTAADTLDRVDPAALPQNVAAWAVVAWLASQSRLAFGPLATK